MKKSSKMKKSNPNQKTLFQSWGKQTAASSTSSSRQESQNNTGFDPLEIIDLGDDDEDDGLLAAAMEMETVDQSTLAQTSTCSNVSTCISTATPKEIEYLPGFDMEAGNVWIYPTNYPVRDYQFKIVENALMTNTLVTLPTGLGKTFIAAVLMYNYYRWYPQGKVIFMAPTKPLVAQQIEACYNIMGIPESDTSEMTGNMAPNKREVLWKSKRVFFLTPQVLQNDLGRGSCDAERVVLLVFDEAHKALGNHSYCQVIREIYNYTRNFRVLALSATPGDDIKAVQQVMTNLLISHMELRSEDSPDIQAYTHKRTVDKIVVPLGEDIVRIKTQFLKVLEGIVGRLFCNRALWQKDPQRVTKFMLLTGRNQFREREAEGYTNGQKGAIEGDFAMAISLYHAYELLHQHGILSFYNFIKAIVDGSKGMARARSEIKRHTDFMEVMDGLRESIEKPPDEMSAETSALFSQFTSPRRQAMMREAYNPLFRSHPKLLKLEEVIVEHFQNFAPENSAVGTSTADGEEVNTRVMIFSQYRDSVGEITAILNKHKPLVRVMSFIGQASTGKSSRGLSQKEQLEVVQRFRKGGYNTLVATCVGEEGLDIGDVDLIVCFDAHASPIRLVQRMGRTGRKRNGRIVVLVTEGKEEQVYKRSLSSKKSIHKAIVQGSRSFVLYDDNPRMIPRHLTPHVHKMEMTVGKYIGNVKKKRKSDTVAPKGNISSFLSKSTSSKPSVSRKDDGFLTYEELDYWQKNFKLPNCEAGTTPSKRRRSRNSLSDPPVKELSLNDWMPWQNVPSPVDKITHSRRTEHMIEILEFIELHNGEDDAYDVEMMSFLNEEDLPGMDDGSENNADDAPMIILDDGDDIIRLGNGKKKNENQKKKRKVSTDNNTTDSKKKKTSTGKTKVSKQTKEKKKSKESKKPSPKRKWKEYLKAFEDNEDTDFEPVENDSTVGDHVNHSDNETSCQPEESLDKNKVGEQQHVDVDRVETDGETPVKDAIEENEDDDTLLSSQQVSQLLPSVTPSNLFRPRMLVMENCAKEVPTPPSLDSLNEISLCVSSLTGDSIEHEKRQTQLGKIAGCRRNIQEIAKKDACELKLTNSDDENANERTEIGGLKCGNVLTKKLIIEEPPDLFEFEECDEDFKEDYDNDEEKFEFQDNILSEKLEKKKTGHDDDLLDESANLFGIDFTDVMLNDNENENVGLNNGIAEDGNKNMELDNEIAGDFSAKCKERTKNRDTHNSIQQDKIQEGFLKPMHKTLKKNESCSFGAGIVSTSASKSSIDYVELGDDILNDGLLTDLMPDDNAEDLDSRSNKVIRDDFENQSNSNHKLQINVKGVSNNLERDETSSKVLKTSLKSSISKLSAFERRGRNSEPLDDGIEFNDRIKTGSRTVAESTRMSPTSENHKHEEFEFKKPSISVVNRFPKSPGCSGLNHHTQGNPESPVSRVPTSKMITVSTKLSLKKTADHQLEKGKQSSSGYNVTSPNVKERNSTEAFSTNKRNIQKDPSSEGYRRPKCSDFEGSSQTGVSPLSKYLMNVPLRERIGFCGKKNILSPSETTIDTEPVDDDSPIIRDRPKSKLHPTISSPVSPPCHKRDLVSPSRTAFHTQPVDEDSPIVRNRSKSKIRPLISSPPCHTPVDSKTVIEIDEESPLVRRRSKIKKMNGDVVAIAESDGESEEDLVPTENEFLNREKRTNNKKMEKDVRSRRKMVPSDSEEEFMVENHKQGSKGNNNLDTRNRKARDGVKRKRQHHDIPSKKQRTLRVENFVDEEAELSGSDIEEFSDEGSDCGEEFDSFIDDSTQLTQETPTRTHTKKRKSSRDMLAVYRQSLFSPLARDLHFRTPTMCRNKNRYKMKYKVGNSDGSASEAEETYARESDLENELGSDSELDVSGDTLLVEDDDDDRDSFDDDDDEKVEVRDPTPVASQVRRPLKRGKRKRILNESIEETVKTNPESPVVPPSKACITETQYACTSKESSFVKSSTLVNHAFKEPPTRETTPQNNSWNVNRRSSLKDSNVGVDSSRVMANNSLSTTFEFDWGLDFSDSDLLDAVEDKKFVNDDDKKPQAAQDVVTRKSDVCDQEMQEIAFAMAVTDDDVSLGMSEMPSFSLGFDLFGDTEGSEVDISAEATSLSTKQSKDLTSVSDSTEIRNSKAPFTKISPRGANSCGPSFKTSSQSKISTTNTKNDTLSTMQNGKNNAIPVGQNIKNNSLSTNKINRNNNLPTAQNITDLPQHNGFPRNSKNVPSVVHSNSGPIDKFDKWSYTNTSAGTLHSKPVRRTNGLKDVTNMEVKSGGSNSTAKPVPTAFVSPSQKDKGKLVMLADTKEISNSQVVSFVRRKHNIKVEICQLQHCDYVVSNRMGVIRKLTSAVANGANSTKILDKMRVLCDLYDRPCFIVEKDRVKTGETERDYSKSNAYTYTLSCMAQTHIKVLFSQSQEETASLLTDLATLEAKKNTHIVAPLTMNKETQQVFRFLLTIPRVSYITALNMCSSLRTLRDLLSRSAEDLQKTTRQLSESRASEIYSYLRHEYNESMVNRNARKST